MQSNHRRELGLEDLWQHCREALDTPTTYEDQAVSAMFRFVREMMCFPFHPKYLKDPEAVADLLEEAYLKFSIHVTVPDQYLLWEELQGERQDFVDIWLQMRYPPGSDPLTVAAEEAKEKPFIPMPPTSTLFAQVVSIAGNLQMRVGDKDIVLPQERMASVLGVSQMSISRNLALARKRGFLRIVQGCDHSKKRAAKYRFNLDVFSGNGREKQPRSI
jgi:hypothetical protein